MGEIETVRRVDTVTATPQQRAKLYDLIAADPWRGHVKAARMAGIEGTKGQVAAWLDTDDGFQETVEAARGDLLEQAGLGVPHLFKKLASVVNDDGHASQLRAITEALAIRGVRQKPSHVQIEHTGANGGPMEVTNPDVAASLDRFYALADAAVRAASRGRTGDAAVEPDRRGESVPGLPVGGVDRPA